MSRSVRFGVIASIAFIITPIAFSDFDGGLIKVETYLVLALKEFIIGLVLGGVVWMPVRGLEFAGVLLDTQRGSTMGQDFNVIFNAPQTSYTAIFLTQVFSGLFFTTGG